MIYTMPGGAIALSADYALPGAHTDLLHRGLFAVNRNSGGELDVAKVIEHVVTGRLRNITVADLEGKPIGFVLYHASKSDYDMFEALHVIAMYVDPGNSKVTDGMIEFLKELARSLGVHKIIGISRRKGWSRRMQPDMTMTLGVWDV